MICKKNKIVTISLGIILNAIILFPLFIQFFHVLEGHKHTVCTENSTHLHEAKTNCNICDFNYTPFIYEPLSEAVNKTSIEFKTTITNSYNYLYSFNYNLSKPLRGPPVYS